MGNWVDFHSHILPKMDDGSKSTEESLEMIRQLAAQGVDVIGATPHFYPDQEDPDSFLTRRQSCFQRLKSELTDTMPEIRLGAEVYYYSGLSRMEQLPRFCLEGTNLLLVEMPLREWGEYDIRELIDLNCSGSVTVMLAHVERYLKYQKKGVLERLLDQGVLIQVNASFFASVWNRRQAIRMLQRGEIHAIGSDCHNLGGRRPNMDIAVQAIEKKLGTGFSDSFTAYHHRLIRARTPREGDGLCSGATI